ncbi:MAG TPA: MmgE/PrpD family protein [Acidimicrobiales bacterium]
METLGVLEEFVAALMDRAARGLGPEETAETHRTLLNVVGTSVGAIRSREADALVAVGQQLGGSELRVPGRNDLLDRYYVATLIGFAAHFDDFDDTHLATVIHPGAATLGAWYVQGNLEPVAPETALMAFAMGVESQLRVGLAMTPSHYDDGWHITGTCGVIGAAVAAGLMMGLDQAQLAAAIGIAAEMTLGHREAFGTPIKPFHAGKAASNGLFAAALARAGLRTGGDCFAGEPSYFTALAHDHDVAILGAPSIAGRLVLLDNTYKPFPCGIVAHPAIEAAVNLHGRFGDDVDAIDEVLVTCNPLVPELMGRATATTGLEARFCAIHGVSVGLLYGRGGLAEFSDEKAVDARVVKLRGKTKLMPDSSCPRDAATVTVVWMDGRSEVSEVLQAAGSLERPLSDEALLSKFTSLVEPVLPGASGALAASALAVGATTGPTDLGAVIGDATSRGGAASLSDARGARA